MIVGALSCGARCFMACLEDATSPTWANLIGGQENLADAVRRQIDFTDEDGKRRELAAEPATLLVRPGGLHLLEPRLRMPDGEAIAGAFTDFALFAFHNAAEQVTRGDVPAFYLPKLESHLEARLWNDVIARVSELIGLPRGTIKATVLVETLPAAFDMEEILFELREHSAGLNAGAGTTSSRRSSAARRRCFPTARR